MTYDLSAGCETPKRGADEATATPESGVRALVTALRDAYVALIVARASTDAIVEFRYQPPPTFWHRHRDVEHHVVPAWKVGTCRGPRPRLLYLTVHGKVIEVEQGPGADRPSAAGPHLIEGRDAIWWPGEGSLNPGDGIDHWALCCDTPCRRLLPEEVQAEVARKLEERRCG